MCLYLYILQLGLCRRKVLAGFDVLAFRFTQEAVYVVQFSLDTGQKEVTDHSHSLISHYIHPD